jgi:arsenate reductase
MAEAYFRYFAGQKADVYSAGVETHGINPLAAKTLLDDGIDISAHTSNHVDEYLDIPFDYIITVCDHANEVCPIIPGNAKRFHQNFHDPSKSVGTKEEIDEEFKKARNQIKDYCRAFVNTYL